MSLNIGIGDIGLRLDKWFMFDIDYDREVMIETTDRDNGKTKAITHSL